jgi:signal transduction histidine kinase
MDRLKSIKKRLFPSSFEENAHKIHTLSIVGVMIMVAGLLAFIVEFPRGMMYGFHGKLVFDLLVELIGITIGGLVIWLGQKKQIRVATWLLLVFLFTIAVAQLYFEGQPFYDIAGLLALILTLVLAAILLDLRGIWFVFIVSALVYMGITILSLNDQLPAPVLREPETQAQFSVVMWLAIAGIISVVLSSSTFILQKYRYHLEQIVAERTKQLEEAQESLLRQERLAALGELSGSIGHELRNPLSVIDNAVYYLQMVLKQPDPKVREYLEIINAETKNAEKIISDLLEFSRIKSIDRQPVNAAYLVEDALKRYPAPQGISVVVDLSPDLPRVLVDPRHIEQVLGNLLANAYQAMPDGGVLSIQSSDSSIEGIGQELDTRSSSLLGTGDYLRVEIKDTGVGISPENLEKIFEPLFTTKAKGIGLGLAVSQKLLEANGGGIAVESEVGQGTTFWVFLPIWFNSNNTPKHLMGS